MVNMCPLSHQMLRYFVMQQYITKYRHAGHIACSVPQLIGNCLPQQSVSLTVRELLESSSVGPILPRAATKENNLFPLLPNSPNIRIQQLGLLTPELASSITPPKILRFFHILITLSRTDSSLPLNLLQCGAQN